MAPDSLTSRPIASLRPHPDNPRGRIDPAGLGELAASIRAQGILQPLLVTPEGLVVAGHRRLAAATIAGMAHVPVIIRSLTRDEQLAIMLVENIQREDLSPLQEARAYRSLLDLGLGRSEIARRVGVTAARISERLNILRLDPEVQGMFDRGQLPITLARPLLQITDWPTQRRLATLSVKRTATVAEIESMIQYHLDSLNAPKPILVAAAAATRAAPLKPPAEGPTRADALTALRSAPDRRVSLDDLARALEDVCCACGMGDLAAVCASCPLPQFLDRVASCA